MRQLNLKGQNIEETKKLYIKYYIQNYIKSENGNYVNIFTTDNIKVNFYNTENIHAYSSSLLISKKNKKRQFDFERARRLNWIKEIIEEKCKDNIQKKDCFDKKKKRWERHYFLPSKKYYLMLAKNKRGEFVFKSHYILNTHREYLKKWKFFNIK